MTSAAPTLTSWHDRRLRWRLSATARRTQSDNAGHVSWSRPKVRFVGAIGRLAPGFAG